MADSATSLAFAGHGRVAESLDETIAIRERFLVEYQDAAYARRYTDLVARVRRVEAERTPGLTGLSDAVARYAFKLMAYKDEYEVARLYTSGDFRQRLRDTFEGKVRVRLNLAPPLLAKRDAEGRLLKREFGAWIFPAFGLLKRFRFLRGSAFDPFGQTAERRMERQLVVDYAATVEELLGTLTLANHALAVEIARVPEHVRGYGHVKHAHLTTAKAREATLLAQWRNPLRVVLAA